MAKTFVLSAAVILLFVNMACVAVENEELASGPGRFVRKMEAKLDNGPGRFSRQMEAELDNGPGRFSRHMEAELDNGPGRFSRQMEAELDNGPGRFSRQMGLDNKRGPAGRFVYDDLLNASKGKIDVDDSGPWGRFSNMKRGIEDKRNKIGICTFCCINGRKKSQCSLRRGISVLVKLLCDDCNSK